MTAWIARTDRSVLGRWWWTVDRWMLGAMLALAGLGLLMVATASPAVAERLGLPSFFFLERHILYLLAALAAMLGLSMLGPVTARRLALVGFAGSLVALALVPVLGAEAKGATRWLRLFGFSLQPSEFAKPLFAVATAWVLARGIEGRADGRPLPGRAIAALLLAAITALLLAQPDLGMTAVVAAVWTGQFFLAGMPVPWLLAAGAAGLGGLGAAYLAFPHVASRIDRFLDPASGDTYQIDRAIEAFGRGGLLGAGPGQGTVKAHLPDAHADFIFAVAGEELGLLACLLLVGLYAAIAGRALRRLMAETDLFLLLAGSGLVFQLCLQALVHIGSSLHLIPAKGMTLPLISYGGSSLVATGIALGLLLAFTRRRPGAAGRSAAALGSAPFGSAATFGSTGGTPAREGLT